MTSLGKPKLKWRIFALLLAFTATLLVLLWTFQTVFLSDMYKFVRRREMDQAISLVEENLNSPNYINVLYDLESNKEIYVRPTSEFVMPRHGMHMRGHMYQENMTETITEVRDFLLADGSVLSLTFYAVISPVEATVSTLKIQVLIISGIMLAISIVIGIITSRWIAEPIEEINKTAKMLTVGDYDLNFKGEGYREIEELSSTLNIASQELSKVEEIRRELMANISHDLRTPLALIYSYAEMMNDFPEEVTVEQTKVIMDETKRLTSLVNDILDISKLEAGTMSLNRERFNLTRSIEEVVNRMGELVKEEGFSLKFNYKEEVQVDGDKVKIIQAFYNLLLNAITHSGGEKKIDIKQTVKEDRVKLEVIDYGEGISKENLPNIWQRYYKIDKNHNRPVIGSGLGLSIVREIIDLHEGDYGVESEEGQGSNFWFSLKKYE